MNATGPVSASLNLGVVMRRTPGVTRWAAWAWKAVGVLPGASAANWRVLREEDGATEYHADTVPLTLWSSEAEAYMTGLSEQVPSIYVVLRENPEQDPGLEVLLVTASPFEAQDYADNGDDLVEKVPMTAGLIAWISEFAEAHFHHEEFIKRRRDKKRVDLVEDGKGDARIRQVSDVYRAPRGKDRLQ